MSTDNAATIKDSVKHAPSSNRDAEMNSLLEALKRDGYAVMRGLIPPDEAQEYANYAQDCLEGCKEGYKRDDPSTSRRRICPEGKAHAQWVWDLKTKPRWVEVFEKFWGTKDLSVSFDGANLSIPLERKEGDDKPWPHADQSPHKPDLFCIQSLINLLLNEEEDGGLWIMKGSAGLFPELVEAFDLQSASHLIHHPHD